MWGLKCIHEKRCYLVSLSDCLESVISYPEFSLCNVIFSVVVVSLAPKTILSTVLWHIRVR